MTQIDDRTSQQIDLLAEEGNVLLEDDNRPNEAIEKWREALNLLPSPAKDHPESLWLNASIGEAWWVLGETEQAATAFEIAYQCPDGHLNPLVLLRLGELALARGSLDEAAKFLLQGYMLEGEDLFEESTEALDFLKSRHDLSA